MVFRNQPRTRGAPACQLDGSYPRKNVRFVEQNNHTPLTNSTGLIGEYIYEEIYGKYKLSSNFIVVK